MKHLMFTAVYPERDIGDAEIVDIFHAALDHAGAHMRRTAEYSFYPQGVTAIAILAESHAAIHTWPEGGYAMVDYFACSEAPDFNSFERFFGERGFWIKDREVHDRQ
jgi:S-adenosylmethionine decarboxylase proenzyme